MELDRKVTAFDCFWNRAIYPAIKKCLKDIEHDEDLFPVRLIDEKIYKKRLKTIFNRKREWLKRIYLPNQGSQAVLDFHKLGSILCRSIIADKPFKFDMRLAEEKMTEIKKKYEDSDPKKMQWEIDHIYINYKLAFLVSEGVAYIDLLYQIVKKIKFLSEVIKTLTKEEDKEKFEKKKELYERFKNELLHMHSLSVYKKSPDHDDFATSMIVALMKHDLLMRKFDYLSYAAVLYQWQEHTKLIMFSKIIFSKCSEYIPQYLQDEYDDMFVSKKEIK